MFYLYKKLYLCIILWILVQDVCQGSPGDGKFTNVIIKVRLHWTFTKTLI